MSNARTGERFPIQLPTRIQNADSGEEHLGVTCNLSAAGAYILAGSNFEVGSLVAFEIVFPPDVIGANSQVRLQCRGRVLRTGPAPGTREGLGLACVIDTYEFVRDSSSQGMPDAEADNSR